MNIITVTINPAIDVHISCRSLRINSDNSARLTGRDSGGKGVNISRALHTLGTQNTCYVIVGEENRDEFLSPLRGLGMSLLTDTVPGHVRENINIHTESGDTVLGCKGACVDNSAILRMKERLLPLINDGTYLCFSGRIPHRSDKDAVISALLEFKAKGARLILDSKALSCDDIAKIHPYMIKPNEEELTELTESGNIGKADVVETALRLSSEICENILVTLGERGAVFASCGDAYEISSPKIDALSTTGAGDSAIAGFLAATALGYSLQMCLRESIAYASASCLAAGTLPPKREDVEKLKQAIQVKKVLKTYKCKLK